MWVPFINFRFVISVALERSGLPLLHSLRAKRGRRRGDSRRERGGHAECHFVACGAVFVCACRREKNNENRARVSPSFFFILSSRGGLIFPSIPDVSPSKKLSRSNVKDKLLLFERDPSSLFSFLFFFSLSPHKEGSR